MSEPFVLICAEEDAHITQGMETSHTDKTIYTAISECMFVQYTCLIDSSLKL